MRLTLEVSESVFKEKAITPFFFVKKITRERLVPTNNKLKQEEYTLWQSVDKNIELPIDRLKDTENDYHLCILDQAYKDDNREKWFIVFHVADVYDTNDYFVLLKDCYNRSLDKNDKYYFVALLWVLDKLSRSGDALFNALLMFEQCYRTPFFPILEKICCCLSENRQKTISRLFSAYRDNYKVYMPSVLKKASEVCDIKSNIDWMNLFQLVDAVLYAETFYGNPENDDANDNMYLQLKKWLGSNEPLQNYQILIPLYSVVSEPTRLKIVQRYFHDIRLGNTTFDCTLLEQFKDNKYEDFIRFRYSLETPCDTIIMTVPLLCDCIISIYKSNGEAFQTYNGVLDYVITHCDSCNPSFDFKMERFLPTCSTPIIVNPSFKGFIDYEILYKKVEEKMSDESLLIILKNLLDKFGQYDTHLICKLNKGAKSNYIEKDNVSTNLLRDYIHSIISKYEDADTGEIIVPQRNCDEHELFLINQIAVAEKMRIKPSDNIEIGSSAGLSNDIDPKEFVLQSLKQHFTNANEHQSYVELPFNEQVLNDIKCKYYYNSGTENNFTKTIIVENKSIYCAPERNLTNNIAIGIPFFWCRGHECYCNNLYNQTIGAVNNWEKYSLYHITEIIGFPKIHKRDGVYEADKIVRSFIALALKVKKIFNRLKCKECGHLIFPKRTSGFNKYSWHSCINPSCKERGKSLYLNYCFHCKSGLIDSRESKKCPNGWYICPKCLSCCDDEQYEKLTKKYIVSNIPIPNGLQSMLGKGHNDKMIYFCPECGGKLENIQIIGVDIVTGYCPQCNKFQGKIDIKG